ncbi:MAG: hypothetical protein LBT85_00685 [Bifidobacteriaceae bacterium]|jgi:phosphoglycerol transferase MdoB-like AlkP superfamily enzyme|nr:hypothetical protein [Bifidobacteriaceae bacterium]
MLDNWFKFSKKAVTERYSPNEDNLNKLGGFLLFFGILFAIETSGIIVSLINLTDNLTMSDPMAFLANILRGVASVFAGLAAFYIFRKSKRAILFAQICVTFLVLPQIFLIGVSSEYITGYNAKMSAIINYASGANVNTMTPGEAIASYHNVSIPALIIQALFGIIVIIYFLNSRRVQKVLK